MWNIGLHATKQYTPHRDHTLPAHSVTHRPYCIRTTPCHCVRVMVSVQWRPKTKSIGPTLARYRPDVVHSPVLRPAQHLYMYRPIVYILYRQPVHCARYTCIVGYCTHHSAKMSCFKVMFLSKLWQSRTSHEQLMFRPGRRT